MKGRVTHVALLMTVLVSNGFLCEATGMGDTKSTTFL
jgi:hypothetical protein